MNISEKGIELIKKFEGCHLTAYLCPAGKWTIGYGHTAGVKKGMTITQEQADEYLKNDIVKFEKRVMKYNDIYHWNQNEFDALVLFAMNNGSIGPLTKYGTRTKQTIADKILEYNKAKNTVGKLVVLNGLVRRRKEEQALFLAPVETDGKIKATELHSGIKEYSWKKDGAIQLSGNFTVREFRCKDNSDRILIDVDFVKEKLQAIREHFGKPVTINSAYRNAIYNKKVGGASNSYHTKGQAFDIVVKGVAPLEVAKYAEQIGVPGIIQYNSFVHVDSREKRYRSRNNNGKVTVVESFLDRPVLRLGSRGEEVKEVQQFLADKNIYHGAIDGVYGPVTQQAVIEWQGYCEIAKDGVVGKGTWATMG